MSVKRVLHPITRLIVGGAQENTIYTAALLDKSRFSVEILTGPQTGSEGSLFQEVKENNIPLIILEDLVREINPYKDWLALSNLTKTMRNQYDIVHTHSSKAGILGRWAAKRAGVPVIVHTVHGWGFHNYMPTATRLFYILLERFTSSFSDCLIAVSKFDIQEGIEAGIGNKNQYQLIRSAIPSSDFIPEEKVRYQIRRKFGISDHIKVIGNVGRFSRQKNPLGWLNIAAGIHQNNKHVHFVLVGDGPLRSEVESKIVSLGLSDVFTITGLRRDVKDLLAIMDIFMITSLWEGLPRTVLQAMSAGMPVVSYNVGGIPEIVKEGITGFICEPGDTKKMIERCNLLLNNSIRRKEMGKKGQSLIGDEFELSTMIDQISALYEELLTNKKMNGNN